MATSADIKQYKLQLVKACSENNTNPVRRLVEAGIEWDVAMNDDKQNVLHIAAKEGGQDIVDFLLAHPKVTKRIDGRDRALRTPLHLAAAMGFTQIAQKLIECKATVNVQDEEGSTPLQLAVKFDWAEVAGLLLDCKANPKVVDLQGKNAMDLARRKPNSEVAQLLLSGAGRRTGMPFQQQGHPQDPNEDDQHFPLEVDLEAPAPVKGSPNRQATVEFSGRELRPAPTLLGSQLNVQPSASSSSWFRSAADAEKKSTAGQASIAATAYGVKTSPAARAEKASFRLHFFFDEQVKRLEFEVEWQDTQPAAGTVKPGGEADCRGVLKGDSIVEISGRRTAGKGREELLPALKDRPLLMKVERAAQVPNVEDPYLELDLATNLSRYTDHGMDLTQRGQLLVATAIRENSRAFAAGLLEGDAIVGVSGQDVTNMSKNKVMALLEARPHGVMVWRRPIGASITTPWATQE